MSNSLRKALEVFDLLQDHEFKAAPHIAKEVGVASRTVQAYIRLFREFDWPIESSHAKGYRLANLGVAARLTERELLLLAVLLAQGSSLVPQTDFEKLSHKITELLTPSAQARIGELKVKLSADGNALRDLEVLTAVGRCLSDPHLQLVMDYKKAAEAETVRRNVVPLTLRYQDGWYYVDVFDLDKRGTRSFRLDRFQRVQLLRQERPIPRPGGGVSETHKWDFGEGEPMEIMIEVTPKLGAWLEEKPAHHSQVLRAGTEVWEVRYSVKRLDMFVDWFMSLRGARAVTPSELLREIRTRATALLKASTLEVDWN